MLKTYNVMKLEILKTEEEYKQALAQLEKVFDAPAGSDEGARAELLMSLIEEYESKHYSI